MATIIVAKSHPSNGKRRGDDGKCSDFLAGRLREKSRSWAEGLAGNTTFLVTESMRQSHDVLQGIIRISCRLSRDIGRYSHRAFFNLQNSSLESKP